MVLFIILKKRYMLKLSKSECSEVSVITKSLEASRVLADAFKQLKLFVMSHNFKNDDDEISFFKEIKPRLCFRLIYYRKVYNIEMNRPIGIDKQREYLCDILNDINKYNSKRLDFIRYYRSGSTHLDTLYFLRDSTDAEQYLETFYHELDPKFSTNCDFKVAKILSNDMLYQVGEVQSVDAVSDNKVNRFNGTGVGIYATSNGKQSINKASYQWFEYKEE